MAYRVDDKLPEKHTMSSAICQNFVQNAWKKELCSNCFKSKDEHTESPKPRPIQLVSNDKVEGIIKNGRKTGPKLSVCFVKNLTEVIGYGGEDWCSENEENEENTDSSDEDYAAESDEEECLKELQRITKENTDFNTTSLTAEVETLLVSVTPFGEDSNHTPTRKYGTKPLSHIPITKNNKEVIAEIKSNVVLTSYAKNEEKPMMKEEKSLLDEITETLENSKNPIQIISKKKPSGGSNKENEESTEEAKETEIKKETITETKSIITEKKVNLSRTPALKKGHRKTCDISNFYG
ncbi:hypothetical protein NQ317_014365 [Molorchus minor]|uniref:Uncharacterized protein n=1 Tax=Molorchus minor TaxID=1323400 RepID=A0ABQ9K859_9CUCU|nr:hypothetical protein NQ317_014365 [Molorchus minor]